MQLRYKTAAAVPDDHNIEISCADANTHITSVEASTGLRILKSNTTEQAACLSDPAATRTPGVPNFQEVISSTVEAIPKAPTRQAAAPPSSSTVDNFWDANTAALSVSIGVVSLALVVVLLLYIRLRRRKTASLRRDAFHEDGSAMDREADEKRWSASVPATPIIEEHNIRPISLATTTVPQQQSMYSTLFGGIVRPHRSAGAPTEPVTSRPSLAGAFSENESTAIDIPSTRSVGSLATSERLDGPGLLAQRQKPADLFQVISVREPGNPEEAENTHQQEVEPEILQHRLAVGAAEVSLLQRKMKAWESSMHHLARRGSLAPPSKQASTVGAVSAVSDEHYHRRKASTMTPSASKSGSGRLSTKRLAR